MNKSIAFKFFMGTVLALGLSAIPAEVAGETPVESCSKELLLSYFPESFVKETLGKFKVPQDKWDEIVKELNEKDKEVVKLVEEKASKQNPNPLKDPQQRQAAVKVFKETLTEVFGGVLKKNGINDDSQIQQMLDDIQQQKAKRFAQCMEQQRAHTGQPQAAAEPQAPVTQPKVAAPVAKDSVKDSANDEDDDSDDDDDDSDDEDDNS